MKLYKSKGQMYEWVTHTGNVIKGECPHDCEYCHPAGTLILMADFTQKPIENIAIGDDVIGVNKAEIGYRRFVVSKVVDASVRCADVVTINTTHGKLNCTKEHPVMGSSPTRNVREWRRAGLFKKNDLVRYVSSLSKSDYSREHRLGYIKGVRDGDGCVFHPSDNYGHIYYGFEMVCVDMELSEHVKSEIHDVLGVDLLDGVKRKNKKLSYGSDCPMLHTRITRDVKLIEQETFFRLNADFAKGYIAGMIDTDGSVEVGPSVRIAQSKTANTIKYNHLLDCCSLLGLRIKEEKAGIRILLDFETKMFILFECGLYHSYKSKRLLIGSSLKGSTRARVTSTSLMGKLPVFNLQTECASFIANGFIVHNCYMKRWGKQNPLHFDEHELTIGMGSGKFIFVGSGCDMFANDIPVEWIEKTIAHCLKFDNRYLFQSKNPFAMLGFLPFENDNLVVCTTIETNRWYPDIMHKCPTPQQRAYGLASLPLKRYVTIEPIMDFDLEELVELIKICNPVQVNIGADSGGNKLPEPTIEKVRELVEALSEFTVISKKRNLGRLETK